MATNNKRNLNYVVNTKFKGDKSDLDKTLKELRQQLNEISNINVVVDNQSLKDGVQAAKDLQKYLDMSMDTSTGNLDLSKFSQTLRQAGTDVNTLSAKLLAVGDQGTDAFLNFAQAVSQAQIPMRRTNALLSEMWATMKNTVRWQLTSSMLHGFMGAMQQAIGYAKDLDRSLNQIRIVSGKSGDDMAKFAVEANKAAQALSTTTVDYTDASLIYYQQGLSDSEVKARTDITIKAANAAGSSAEEMSEYLTAIWNSYQVGSKDLERFVDVIAKLGAETATSLEEIATGMQKVAATGNAVGVEYEQLASILATVSSVTRESPETSGTAFKTIFARMGDLKLGQGEDGETLGTVSSQLAQIGINILDVNGDLRDMGDVIEELGNKWQDMSASTQVAVAQAVAGKRQYTQLIALFDNWNMYLNNMAIASGAEGQLENMANIYEESWAAANKRLKASFEEMYGSLIDSDAIIGLTDALAEIVKGVDNAIDSFGGLQGVIATVGGLLATKFAKQASDGIKQFGQNLRVTFGMARKDMVQVQQDVQTQLSKLYTSQNSTAGDKAKIDYTSKLIAARIKLNEVSDQMTESERQLAEAEIKVAEASQKNINALADQVDKTQAMYNASKKKAGQSLISNANEAYGEIAFADYDKESFISAVKKEFIDYIEETEQVNKQNAELGASFESLSANLNSLSDAQEKIEGAKSSEEANKKYNETIKDLEKIISLLPEGSEEVDRLKKGLEELKNKNVGSDELGQFIRELQNGVIDIEVKLPDIRERFIKTFGENITDKLLTEEVIEQLKQVQNDSKAVEKILQELQVKGKNIKLEDPSIKDPGKIERITAAVGGLASAYGLYNSVIHIGTVFQNENATSTEKLMAVMGSLSGIMMNLTGIQSALNTVIGDKTLLMLAGIPVEKQATMTIKERTAAIAAQKAVMLGWIAVAAAVVIALGFVIKKAVEWNTIGEKVNKEQADRQLEQIKNAQSQKKSNEELSNSIDGLISEYKELAARQGDITEVSKSLEEKNSELINSYKEYANSLANAGINVDTLNSKLAELERYAELGLLTGDFSKYEATKAQIDNILEEGALDSYRQGTSNAAISFVGAGQEDKRIRQVANKAQLSFDINGIDESVQDQIINSLKDFGARIENRKLVFDEIDMTTNPERMVELTDALRETYGNFASITDLNIKQINDSTFYKQAGEFLNNTSEEINELRSQTDSLQNSLTENLFNKTGMGNVKTFGEYVSARDEFIKTLVNEENISSERAKQMAEEADTFSKLGLQYRVAEELLEKTGKKVSQKDLAESLEGFSEDELTVALSIIPDLSNYKDAAKELTDLLSTELAKTLEQTYTNTSSLFFKMMSESEETNSFSNYFADLQSNTDFQNFLQSSETKLGNWQDFVEASYEQQYGIVSQYYAKQTQLASNAIETEQALLEQQIIDKNNQLKTMEANQQEMDEARKAYTEAQVEEERERIAEEFKENFGIDITLNEEQINSQIEQLEERLEQLSNKKIELAVNWDGTDQIVKGYDKIESLSSMLANDVKQVGKNYLLTADQAREWLEVYPELFDKAEVTTNGLIQLDKQKAQTYIHNRDTEMDAAINEVIGENNLRISSLERDLEFYDQQLKLIDEQNQSNIASTELKKKLRENYSEHQHTKDLEDVTSRSQALVDQLSDENTYNAQVVQDSQDTANDLLKIDEKSAQEWGKLWKDRAEYFDKWASSFSKAYNAAIQGNYREGMIYEGLPTAFTPQAQEVKVASSTANYVGSSKQLDDAFTDKNKIRQRQAEADKKNREAQKEYEKLLEEENQVTIKQLRESIVNRKNAITDAINTLKAHNTYLLAKQNEGFSTWGASGSGSGKNGGSDKDVATMDELLARYHEITREISLQERELSKLSTVKDRAFGKDRLKALEDEAKALEILHKDNKELLDQANIYLAEDKTNMLNKVSGVQLNSLGEVTNYRIIQKAAQDELERAMNKYNASAQTESDKEAWEKAQKIYEDKMKAIEDYENSLDKAAEAAQELFDIENRLADNKLEKITYEVEYKIALSEDSKKLIDYELEKLADESFTIPEQVFYKTGAVEEIMTQSNLIAQGIAKINADIAEQGGKATDAQIQQLRDYRDQLLSNNEALQEYNKTIRESLVKGLEEVNNKLDKQSAKFATYTNMLNHMKDIAELTGQTLGKNILGNAISNAAYNNAFNSIESSIAEFKTTQEAYEHAKNMLAQLQRTRTIEDDADIKYWKDTLLEMENALAESQNNMLSSWTTAIKAAADRYETEIDSIVQTLEESLSPFRTLDNFQDLFDKRNTLNEQYLSDLEKEYQLNKLNRNILASIADTSSLAAREKLRDLANEIAEAQKNEAKMSKYDLDILQAKYDLRLAEIAMEEAQNNKSQMRLTRDASGNWTYAYTADQNKIDDAGQKYDDALRKMQKISEDYINDLSGDIIKNEKDLAKYIASIDKNMYETDKNYRDKVEAQYSYYLERDKYLRGEFDKALEDLGIKYSDTTLGAIENLGSMTNAHENFVQSADKAFNDAIKASEKYVESTNAVKDKLEPIFGDMEGQLVNISNKSNELGNTVKELVPDMIDYLNKIYTNTSEWSNNMINRIKPVIEAYEELAKATNNAINNTEIMSASNAQQTSHTDYSAQMSKVLEANNDWQQALQSPAMADLILKREQKIQEQGGLNGSKETWKYLVDEIISNLTQKGINVTPALSNYIQKFVQNIVKGIVGYATGGYTGEWGNDGRLAILHQKELVLNQDDTRNMLGAVNILRQMARSIGDQLASNASLAAYNAGHSLSNVPIGLSGGSTGVVQQVVSIDATFPDVKSAYEIELALNNIVNDAAQYASKKKLD